MTGGWKKDSLQKLLALNMQPLSIVTLLLSNSVLLMKFQH